MKEPLFEKTMLEACPTESIRESMQILYEERCVLVPKILDLALRINQLPGDPVCRTGINVCRGLEVALHNFSPDNRPVKLIWTGKYTWWPGLVRNWVCVTPEWFFSKIDKDDMDRSRLENNVLLKWVTKLEKTLKDKRKKLTHATAQ